VAYFKVLSRHSLDGADETYAMEPRSLWLILSVRT